MQHEPDHARDDDCRQAEEQPLAQLVEMLDKRRFLTVI
jgi:hypothetical protein